MPSFLPSPPHVPSAEQFLQALRASRLLEARDLARAEAERSAATRDGRAFADRLVARGLLTAYQAEQLLADRPELLVLGQYRILERLGAGGMGRVYKAEHPTMKRVVALKIVATDSLDDPATEARFCREIQVAAQLSHPNMVTAHDAGEADGLHFLVMEYVDGLDLGQLLEDGGPLPVPLACEYVRQVALGLQHAHEQGLVHGDIKPANLLVRRHGADLSGPGGPVAEPLVKILDLGLARRAGSCSEPPAAAGPAGGPSSGLQGTPDYLAPEQACAGPAGDIRSDLYSLGCTFYQLLTGQVPFPGGTWVQKLWRHHAEAPTPVRELRPQVPPEVVTIVERLLAKDPADRYQTPGELAGVLHAWLTGRGWPAARTPSTVIDAPPVEQPQEPASQDEAATRKPEPAPAAPWLPDSPARGRSWERVRLASLPAALTAVAAGLGIAWALRYLPPGDSEAAASVPAGIPPRIHPRPPDPPLSRPFPGLAAAIARARDGDTIVLQGDGPLRARPLAVHGKALTIKAAPGCRPRVEFAPAAEDPAWQPLLATDRALTLEGIDLAGPRNANGSAPDTVHLIYGERAPLRLVDCRLEAPGGRALVVCREVRALEIRHCLLRAHAAALCIEVGDGPAPLIDLAQCTLAVEDARGAALSLWNAPGSGHPAPRLRLQGNTIRAGRVIALAGLAQGVAIRAHGNTFTFGEALLSGAGSPGPEGWRRAAHWEGRDNVYLGPGVGGSEDGHAAGRWDPAAAAAFRVSSGRGAEGTAALPRSALQETAE